MTAEQLLKRNCGYCRRVGMASRPSGGTRKRRKLVSRLRIGGA